MLFFESIKPCKNIFCKVFLPYKKVVFEIIQTDIRNHVRADGNLAEIHAAEESAAVTHDWRSRENVFESEDVTGHCRSCVPMRNVSSPNVRPFIRVGASSCSRHHTKMSPKATMSICEAHTLASGCQARGGSSTLLEIRTRE